ncbi:MAG: sensor domain-containing diguanylate cyclase [Chloroflexi bacterium]|nr:sensor domain-containing diguanylate cyclase [Chloroflexota bacterium]
MGAVTAARVDTGSGLPGPSVRDVSSRAGRVPISQADLLVLLRAARMIARECVPPRLHPKILQAAASVSGATRLTLLLNLPAIEAAGRTRARVRESMPHRIPTVLTVGARIGRPMRLRRGSTVSVAGSVAEWVLENRRVVRIDGPDHPVPEIAARLGRNPDAPESALMVPLVHVGQVLGVLCAGHHLAGSLTPRHASRLVELAPMIATSLVNAQRFAMLAGQSVSDPLTGLFNRGGFDQRLREELERSTRSRVSGALIMLDLDHFKQVNDTYGHLAGDAVIRLIATKAIKGQTRSYDVPCRVGGDEFAVILPHTSLADALNVADRIRRAVMNAPTDAVGVPVGLVGASLGVAVFPASDVKDDDLVAQADQAMYRAKHLGRNRIQVAGAV